VIEREKSEVEDRTGWDREKGCHTRERNGSISVLAFFWVAGRWLLAGRRWIGGRLNNASNDHNQ
jgi:hypothetical protein